MCAIEFTDCTARLAEIKRLEGKKIEDEKIFNDKKDIKTNLFSQVKDKREFIGTCSFRIQDLNTEILSDVNRKMILNGTLFMTGAKLLKYKSQLAALKFVRGPKAKKMKEELTEKIRVAAIVSAKLKEDIKKINESIKEKEEKRNELKEQAAIARNILKDLLDKSVKAEKESDKAEETLDLTTKRLEELRKEQKEYENAKK